jgi:sarcosine oxidase
MREMEIAVVGAGPVGSSLTRRLAEAGHSVVCFGPEVGQTPFSSHDDSGRITRILDPSEIWATLAARSIADYADIEARSGIRFHHPVGVLWSARSRMPLDALDTVRVAFDVVTNEGLGGWEGSVAFEGDPALLEGGAAGYIAPRDMVRAHRRLATSAGARFDSRVVTALEPANGRWSMRLTEGDVSTADRVVIAAGAGTRHLVDVGISVTGEVVIDAAVSDADGERYSRLPCIGRLNADGSIVEGYLTPPIRSDGGWIVKFGAEADSPVLGTAGDVADWMRGNAHEVRRPALEAALRALVPGIEFGAIRSRPCMYARTSNGLPIIAEVRPGLTVAAGGNGRMAKSADAVAALAATLVTEGTWTDDELAHDLFE